MSPFRVIPVLVVMALTTTSDADLGTSCRAVCGRVTTCKIMSSSLCMKLCMTPGTDEHENYKQAKMSCPALAKQLTPSKWLCSAEGASSYGYDMDGTLPDDRGTQEIFELGSGRTRSDAAYQAMNNCNATMTVQLDLQNTMNMDTRWGSAITSKCHITNCIGPSSNRKP